MTTMTAPGSHRWQTAPRRCYPARGQQELRRGGRPARRRLDVRPGRVTALVGDNGAGKSTLIKGIAGIHGFDAGEYTFEGKPVTVHSPKDSNALGIEVVYQDLALCDNLDVVQNMYLGRELKKGGCSTRTPWRRGPRRHWPGSRCAR